MQADRVGVCRSCGAETVGCDFAGWVRPTFTDHDKLLPGTVICQACQFCFTDQNKLLGWKLGKSIPQRARNYSHFVINGAWLPMTKADKRRMLSALTSEAPEVAVIADSGQKHIIFRARPGWWQFEEQALSPDPFNLGRLTRAIECLLGAGFSKAECESGQYAAFRIIKCGMDTWRYLEDAIGQDRGSALFSLALFLAQKEGVNESGDSGEPVVANLARDAGGVQDAVRPKHLAAVRGRCS